MPTTPIGAAPYPAGTDADDVPADLEALAVWASTRTNMRFADAAARDAAITSPVAGMIAWLDTPGSVTVRTAAAWKTLWSALAWTDITLPASCTTYGTTPQAALDGGNFIVLKGGIQRSTPATNIIGNALVGTIPSSLGVPLSGDFPIASQWLAVTTGRLYVATSRDLTYVGADTGFISLNGVRIPLA
ncbi:hypothetical protein OHA37_27110 [Streptomyces sp. NBC_00335]|uniref:hypothetical protein n=1 Tax=unclassified Streptomyces TaxID=2593676 RepID=UPI00225AFA4A|nr:MULTISPECIES: hypothetical protein [unclassified Streptomyces]MCX5407521.1 hypothetical protein [Streptomyces sp. NBC_00086]